MAETDFGEKFDHLLERLNDVSNGLVAVSTNLSFLSKNVEIYQKRLDDHISTITGELSDLKQEFAVSKNKVHELEKEREKRNAFNAKSALTILGAVCAFLVSVTTNIVLLFIKK